MKHKNKQASTTHFYTEEDIHLWSASPSILKRKKKKNKMSVIKVQLSQITKTVPNK